MNEIGHWRGNEVARKFEKLDNFLDNFVDKFDAMLVKMAELEQVKTDKYDHADLKKSCLEWYEQMDIKLDFLKSNLLTLEHYAERFIPIKI